MIKNAGNAEAPRMRGSDTLAKIAGAAAGIAGGYALGKSFAKDSFGTPVDQKQVFRSFR